jgi:hypothetical protein
VTRAGALPAVLRRTIDSPGGKCYRHCDRPIRSSHVASGLPGLWTVRACPSGVVSVASYAEWTSRDPSRDARAWLERCTFPKSLVRRWDLRIATREGPELGRAAERFLAPRRPPRGIRVVYWRVYPFKARDGSDRRLLICRRRAHAHPVFFAADPAAADSACPVCARRRR